MTEPERSRAQLFERARRLTALSVEELWLRYLAVGGLGDVFDLDAFLHGLSPLDSADQDALAVAVNERLDDLYAAACVPYLFPHPAPDLPPGGQDPLDVLAQLLPGPLPNSNPAIDHADDASADPREPPR